MTSKVTVARDSETNAPRSTVTTKPSEDVFGNPVGGKTVRLARKLAHSKQGIRYQWVDGEPRDTVVHKVLFNVEHEGETYLNLTKRQINTLLGDRQTRKAFKAMSKDDRDTYRAWKRGQRLART
jgi:hypothetical protein